MNNNLKNFIITGKYSEAKKLIYDMKSEVYSDELMQIAFDTENINVYTFIIFMLLQKEQEELHLLASRLLALPFCYLEGAYQAALTHLRRAIELNPQNIDSLQYLLFFYDLPEPLIGEQEAKEIAKLILNHDPNWKEAEKILSQLSKE